MAIDRVGTLTEGRVFPSPKWLVLEEGPGVEVPPKL